MSIWKVGGGHDMKRSAPLGLWIAISLLVLSPSANACSCAWKGPFLKVAPDAPLVVHGRVIRHHPEGPSPTMDVLLLETWKGAILDSGLVVQMGDGMYCRPAPDSFPPGSEWILALNGPGSKPGSGLALSHCGEFWLRVENAEVIGSIDGSQSQIKRMPLEEIKAKFQYPRFREQFTGRIQAGKRFARPFGSRFEFILEPMPEGWEIRIREYGRDENLARLTPPLHGSPNPRDIAGWHLSGNPSACASREYLAEDGPENPRSFIFSPEVGKRIDGPNATRAVSVPEIEEIRRFGQGELSIDRFSLHPADNGCPGIEWMQFSVRLHGGY